MKKIMRLFFLFIFLFMLISCGEQIEEPTPEIENVFVDLTTIPETIKAFDFDFSSIKVKTIYKDGSITHSEFKEEYLDQENKNKFNTIGSHNITCIINGTNYNFNIVVTKGEDVYYSINKIIVHVSSNNDHYEVNIETNSPAVFSGECETNKDLVTANFSIILPEEFILVENNLTFEFYLDDKQLDTTSAIITNKSILYTFNDVYWSPIA